MADQTLETQFHGTPTPAAPAGEQSSVFAPQSKQRPQRTERRQRDGSFVGVGRRKTAKARVRVKPGEGKIQINGRDLDTYFHVGEDKSNVTRPLEAVGARSSYDLTILVEGGGHTGQSAAILMGLARALSRINREWQPKMREMGFLTRDARAVERKKYGRKKARRRFQFSKR